MKKRHFLSGILIVFASILLFACCSFYVPLKLATPLLLHNSSDKTISWNSIKHAEKYELYLNNDLYKTFNDVDGAIIFDYGESLTTDGLYIVKVRSVGDGKKYTTSEFSESISVFVGEQGQVDNATISQYEFVDENNKAPQELFINKSTSMFSWEIMENASFYVVGIFSNSKGVKYYSTTTNYINLTGYLSGNEALSLRVATVYDNDNNIYFSKNSYYSPLNKNWFTSNFFVFDGGVYDYYIEDYAELQVLYYYAFIERLENYNFLVADNFQSTFESNYSDDSIIRGCFKETYGYYDIPSINKLSGSSSLLEGLNEKAYNVKCQFYSGEAEPVLVKNKSLSEPTRAQNTNYTPYYEFVEYEDRENSYNEFESDNNFLTTTVETSDQLFWAVQEGITPKFNSTSNRAYKVYVEAKKVLNNIIKVGMTDYEKVVSIFDWIVLKTTYDEYAYYQTKYNGQQPMKYACYYLEGVFLDNQGLAVCDGYSKAFSLLCNMEGIDCVRITGTGNTGTEMGGHAWNKVKIDGKWYMVDITWAETISSGVNYDIETVTHRYFLIDHTDFQTSHIESAERSNKYSNYTNDGYYSYYKNTKFTYKNVIYDLLIESDAELTAFLEYCAVKQLVGIDIMFSESYMISTNKLSTYLLHTKPTYQSISTSTNGQYFPYDYEIVSLNRNLKTGLVVVLEPSVMVKNATTLNDWLKLVSVNGINKYNNVRISIDETFIKNLDGYDEAKSLIENLETALENNYYVTQKGLKVNLTLVTSDLKTSFNTTEGIIEITYNIYDIVFSENEGQ